MLIRVSRLIAGGCALCASLLAALPTSGRAQTTVAGPPSEVEVSAVRFGAVRWGQGANGWLETEIELNVRPTPGGAGGDGRFVNRVGVTLELGVEALAGGSRRVDFYRAKMECVALETGRSTVRFYLPPEVVKRDALRPEAKYYAIKVALAGKELPPSRAAISVATLPSAEVLRSFEAKLSTEAVSTDGVLLPQHLTPFLADPGRPGPSPVRQ